LCVVSKGYLPWEYGNYDKVMEVAKQAMLQPGVLERFVGQVPGLQVNLGKITP